MVKTGNNMQPSTPEQPHFPQPLVVRTEDGGTFQVSNLKNRNQIFHPLKLDFSGAIPQKGSIFQFRFQETVYQFQVVAPLSKLDKLGYSQLSIDKEKELQDHSVYIKPMPETPKDALVINLELRGDPDQPGPMTLMPEFDTKAS